VRCRLEAIIDGLSANPRDALVGANEDVQHLARLVDDLQELALAEAGELRLDIGPIDLRDVIVSALRASGLEADPRVRLEIPGAVRARGDAGRVRQCVMNLLTNAGRHTPADGTITVGVEPAADAVRVEVRNTGSDLAPEALAQVFDRFYRADPARQRATGGTGLGLAIVKHLVDAQGGRVWARRDNGLVFGFSLPFDSSVR
jgi:signal transduction histidine kinase